MGMTLWIFICLFCSIGLVQCGIWLVDALRHSDNRQGFQVVPLGDDPETLEASIRFGISQARLSGIGSQPVLFVDMGLGEESRKICDNLLWDVGGVYICDKSELVKTIEELEGIAENFTNATQ